MGNLDGNVSLSKIGCARLFHNRVLLVQGFHRNMYYRQFDCTYFPQQFLTVSDGEGVLQKHILYQSYNALGYFIGDISVCALLLALKWAGLGWKG